MAHRSECRLCNETYCLQGDTTPRLLLCGHTVCHKCLTNISVQPDNNVLCPFDRLPTPLGDSGIWGLKKNFALIEFIERLTLGDSLPLNAAHAPAPPVQSFCSEVNTSNGPSNWAYACNSDVSGLSQASANVVACEENDSHEATLYCLVCRTHLCSECSEQSHSTRTLSRHVRVPVHQKPVELIKCRYHPLHIVEFVCIEDACSRNPFMCYICRDYGRHVGHKNNLLEAEVENFRSYLRTSFKSFVDFSVELTEAVASLRQQISSIEDPETGSDAISRKYIIDYFALLRNQLDEQETAAFATLDAHVHQKLGCLRSHLDDLESFLSHVTQSVDQISKALKIPDMELIVAKPEFCHIASAISKQQTDFLSVFQQAPSDNSIPLTFTKDNRLHIGPKLEMRVVLLGLDQAGKTSILFRLKQNEFINAIPTIGFNVETIEYKNVKFTYWDVGGCTKLRPLWKHYYLNTQGLVYVIDAVDTERLEEAFNELCKLLQEPELKQASFLILANKHNQPDAVGIETLMERFNLVKLCSGRSWHIQPCDAMSGAGIPEALDWLSHQLIAFPSLQMQPLFSESSNSHVQISSES